LKIDINIAKEFKIYMNKYPNLYKNIAITILNEINNKNNTLKILDLGSGPGLINPEIKKLIPNSIIYSLDSSIEMLKNAQINTSELKNEKINGILSNAEKIPLKSNSIDILVSRFSLTYWNNPNLAINEIKRILKPNGKLILEFLNKNFPKWKLFLIKIHMSFKFAGKNVIKYHIDAYENAYDINQVKKFIEENNLKIIEIKGGKKSWKYTIIAK
jgi:ubiquinone/menaquinone biosynthesis C-methylase UbiE